ncbi:MAG TPA: VanZ family protein [Steroidobacteraceae bacterium]|nr:VanZ family protein [Steroidobacteraceae bacterium]
MGHSRTGTSAAGGASGWLLALTIGLILYASFYPFDWGWQRFATAQNGHFPTSLPWGPTLRSDVVANLLFYIPLGALLMARGGGSVRGVRLFVRTVALGTALSVCVEYLQYATPLRTPSLTDTLLNATSTALGAGGFLLVRRVLELPQLRRRSFDPAVYLMLAAWLAFHAAPFIPSLRFIQLRDSLQSILSLQWSAGGIARYLAGYLIVSTALRALVKREHFWIAFGALVFLSLSARVFVVGQQLPFDELLGLLLALPVIAMLRSTPHQNACAPVTLLVIACWLIYGLAPFDFVNRAGPFGWLPFGGFLENQVERGYLQFFEKAFLSLGVVWLIVTAGGTVVLAAILGVSIAAFIEFAQRYLPGRVAEVADPLLVMAAALVVAIGVALRRLERGKSRRSRRAHH